MLPYTFLPRTPGLQAAEHGVVLWGHLLCGPPDQDDEESQEAPTEGQSTHSFVYVPSVISVTSVIIQRKTPLFRIFEVFLHDKKKS